MPKQYFRPAITPDLKEKTMHRYWLATACAVLALGFSACDKKEGMLPKTDGNQASQPSSPDTDTRRDDAAAAGNTAPDRH
jgi:hypothetical protein